MRAQPLRVLCQRKLGAAISANISDIRIDFWGARKLPSIHAPAGGIHPLRNVRSAFADHSSLVHHGNLNSYEPRRSQRMAE